MLNILQSLWFHKIFSEQEIFGVRCKGLVSWTVMDWSELFFLSLVRRLRAGAHQEEAARGPLLCADLPYRSSIKEDASHRPQYVLSRRPGAHQSCQDQILTGTLMCLKPTHWLYCVQTWKYWQIFPFNDWFSNHEYVSITSVTVQFLNQNTK